MTAVIRQGQAFHFHYFSDWHSPCTGTAAGDTAGGDGVQSVRICHKNER